MRSAPVARHSPLSVRVNALPRWPPRGSTSLRTGSTAESGRAAITARRKSKPGLRHRVTSERSRGPRFALPGGRREARSKRWLSDDDRSPSIMASSSSWASQRLSGSGPLLHRNRSLLLERHRQEGFGKAPGFDVVDSHHAVESRRCHVSTVRRKNRSEERRVGKECRKRWEQYRIKKNEENTIGAVY